MSESLNDATQDGPVAANTTETPSKNSRSGNNSRNSSDHDQSGLKQNDNNRSGADRNQPPVFKGRTEEMQGHVFEMPGKPNQYQKTTMFLKEYVAKTYVKSNMEMLALFEKTPRRPSVKPGPQNPVATGKIIDKNTGERELTARDKEMWKILITEEVKKIRLLEESMTSLFQVILGQCNKTLTADLKGEADFEKHQRDGDCLWLLNKIRSLMNRFDASQYKHVALHNLRVRLYTVKQHNMSNTEYYNTFTELLNTMDDTHAWSLPPKEQDPGAHVKGRSDDEIRQDTRDREVAAAFILQSRYHRLINELARQHARGQDAYPKTLVRAYQLLNDEEKIDRLAQRRQQSTDDNRGRGSNRNSNNRNPNNLSGHTFATLAGDPTIPFGALLLDPQSTDTVFRDASQLTDIHTVNPSMCIHSNGGALSYHQKGLFLGIPGVRLPAWYNPHSIANILALSDVRQHCRVTMDTATTLAMIVHLPAGGFLHFTEQANGLYLHCPSHTAFPASGKHSTFIQHEAKGANTACDLHRKTDRSSPVRLELPLVNGLINNLPTDSTTTLRAKEVVKNKELLTPHDNAIPLPADPHQPTESEMAADCGTALLADLHQPIEDGTMAGLHQHIEDGPVDLTMLADLHQHIEDGPVDLLSKNGVTAGEKRANVKEEGASTKEEGTNAEDEGASAKEEGMNAKEEGAPESAKKQGATEHLDACNLNNPRATRLDEEGCAPPGHGHASPNASTFSVPVSPEERVGEQAYPERSEVRLCDKDPPRKEQRQPFDREEKQVATSTPQQREKQMATSTQQQRE